MEPQRVERAWSELKSMRVSRSQAPAETDSALSKTLIKNCSESVSAMHDATHTHQSKPVMKLRLQRGVCALRCSLQAHAVTNLERGLEDQL